MNKVEIIRYILVSKMEWLFTKERKEVMSYCAVCDKYGYDMYRVKIQNSYGLGTKFWFCKDCIKKFEKEYKKENE